MPPALISLPEPVPHPALAAPPTSLLRALLRETPSRFRALLFGAEPATGHELAVTGLARRGARAGGEA